MDQKHKKILQVIIAAFVFWILDFMFHVHGVGESNYYYISKLANSVLFATLFFYAFYQKQHWKKLVYAFIMGTWISFYYLIFAYSGLVQSLGIDAAYGPPPFVIFGVYLSPYLWWVFHALAFYLAIELASLLNRK
jgi:hypothetical protein